MTVDSNISAPTKLVQVGNERYAYRRFGNGSGVPLLFLQHFTGHSTIGIRPSGICLQPAEKLFSLKAPAWEGLPARCRKQSHFSLLILRSRPIELHNCASTVVTTNKVDDSISGGMSGSLRGS